MAVISKELYNEKLMNAFTCGTIHYWSDDCFKGNMLFMRLVFFGATKFFIPIYVVKALINYKKLKSKEFIKELLISQLRSTLYGVGLASLLVSANCVLYKICGKMVYFNVALVAGFFSGLSLLIETKENRILDTIIFFNMVIDAIIRYLNYFDIIKRTKTRETLIFMTISSLVMHYLHNLKEKLRIMHFWFYTPPLHYKANKNLNNMKCSYHKESNNCLDYCFEGTKKYFMLGYLANIIRKLIPTMTTLIHNPKRIFSILFNKQNCLFGLFIGAYVGLYRRLTCFFLKSQMIPAEYHGLVAGFLSAATYAISPNIQLIVIGITTLLQILYHTVLKKFAIKNDIIPQQLIFMCSNAILFHNRIFCSETCPSYFNKMLDICTFGRVSEIYERLVFTLV